MLCDVWYCLGFPPIPVESAAAKPVALVTQPSPAAPSILAAPLKVSPKPQLQKQSKQLRFVITVQYSVCVNEATVKFTV